MVPTVGKNEETKNHFPRYTVSAFAVFMSLTWAATFWLRIVICDGVIALFPCLNETICKQNQHTAISWHAHVMHPTCTEKEITTTQHNNHWPDRSPSSDRRLAG